jgi:hypothetical protein
LIIWEGNWRDPRQEVCYFRDPRRGFFTFVCRALAFFRFGLLITKVPLPKYSA